ncbi:MAG TPA: SDR family NAD(P)-dependent oxidoreductase [Sphingobium sp.]
MKDLAGKTALVTGGGAGIGRCLCLAFAEEGMNVVIADREIERAHAVAKEVMSAGVQAMAYRCDVTDADAVRELSDAAFAMFGEINLLCNNAGVVQSGPLAEAPLEDWEWVFKVNLGGVVNGIRAFVPRMKQQGGGHIVNSASLSGMFALPGFGIYTASKYAVVAISETLRIELERDGIGVSVLCPGPVHSRIDETTRVRSAVERDFVNGPPPLDLRNPEDTATAVVEAVKANRQYIYTHADGVIGTQMRFKEILADFAFAP